MGQTFLNVKDLFVTKGGNLLFMSNKIVNCRLILRKMCLFVSRVTVVPFKAKASGNFKFYNDVMFHNIVHKIKIA